MLTRKEYINALAKLYYVANMSDSDDPRKPGWLRGDECSVHCQAFDKVVQDLGLGEIWGNVLEEGATDYILSLVDQ